MKINSVIATDGLKANDFIRIENRDYKVTKDVESNDLRPGGMYKVFTVDINGAVRTFSLWGSTKWDVGREDGNRIPTHAVVDPTDGYTWSKDNRGEPFTKETAEEFCTSRNAVLYPNTGHYKVFLLVADHSAPEDWA